MLRRSVLPRSVPSRTLPPSTVLLLAGLLVAGLAAVSAPPLRAQFTGDHSIARHRLAEENFFDWKAYQPLQPWRYEELAAPNALSASVGSLSQERFYAFQRIRLQADLSERLRFAYLHQADELFRSDPLYQEVELAWGRPLALGVAGFPQSEKALGNQGFSLQWGQREDWQLLRYTHMAQYALFNDKTEGGIRYDPTPSFDRLEWLFFPGRQVLLHGSAVREAPAVRTQQGSTAEDRYEGARGSFTLDVWLRPTLMLGGTLRGVEELREHQPGTSAADDPAQAQTLRLTQADAYLVLHLDGGDVLETGVNRGVFTNTIASADADGDYAHRLDSRAAYAFWQWQCSPTFQWLFSLQAGEMHLTERRGEAPHKAKDDRSPQVKLGAGVVLAKPSRHRVLFNSTWDLDILTDRAWDGGNIQVQLLF